MSFSDLNIPIPDKKIDIISGDSPATTVQCWCGADMINSWYLQYNPIRKSDSKFL